MWEIINYVTDTHQDTLSLGNWSKIILILLIYSILIDILFNLNKFLIIIQQK